MPRVLANSGAAGEDPGPLAGLPLAIKDNIVTDFGRTSAGSRILETFRSPYPAPAQAPFTPSRPPSAASVVGGPVGYGGDLTDQARRYARHCVRVAQFPAEADDAGLTLLDIGNDLPVERCLRRQLDGLVDEIGATNSTLVEFLMNGIAVTKTLQLSG